MLELRNRPLSQVLATGCASALLAFGLIGCGGTMAFSDTSSIAVVGTPPAPPEPVAKPEPPPPPKRVEVTADKIVIKEKIQFDLNKATIRPESNGLLNEIVEVMKENPQIKKVSIEGHTDSNGSNEYNTKLSDERAKSVMGYLTSHGIDAARLTAKGWGEAKPIDDNTTDAGREQNRRVEFLIVEQDQVKKTYEIDPKTGEKKEVSKAKEKAK
jgi:OOP family OmpA-OmpF porin